MKRIIVLLALMLSGLTVVNAQSDTTKTTKEQTKEQLRTHELEGKASYYGSTYTSARQTANGEWFNKNENTAAHKTLPFGTVVKVTNNTNGKTVTVRINDRGPFIRGRIIDLTPKAAKEICMIQSGVVPVTLEIISMPDNVRSKKAKKPITNKKNAT